MMKSYSQCVPALHPLILRSRDERGANSQQAADVWTAIMIMMGDIICMYECT